MMSAAKSLIYLLSYLFSKNSGMVRAPSAEALVNGQPVTMENVEAFSRAVLEDINPRDSWRASKAFRKHIAVEMAKRALIESVKRCGGEI